MKKIHQTRLPGSTFCVDSNAVSSFPFTCQVIGGTTVKVGSKLSHAKQVARLHELHSPNPSAFCKGSHMYQKNACLRLPEWRFTIFHVAHCWLMRAYIGFPEFDVRFEHSSGTNMSMLVLFDFLVPQMIRKISSRAFRISFFQLGVSTTKGSNMAPKRGTFRLSESTEEQTRWLQHLYSSK